MRRRDFLKTSIGASIGAGTVFSIGGNTKLLATAPDTAKYDLVTITGGKPDAMFDIGIKEMGGMREFVKKGQKVLIKPNIGFDRIPEMAATTNPLLVKRIVKRCFEAGAKEVYVFDNTAQECNNWIDCYKNSGIWNAAKSQGAKIVPPHLESYYQQVDITSGLRLKSVKVHELLFETDVFINVPILEDHPLTKMTCCLKNLIGIVWDRKYWHFNDLNQCIADYATFEKKPVLNVIDCYNIMVSHGPQGVSKEDVVSRKSQILTIDPVAGDIAASKIMGVPTEMISYIPIAHSMGVGNMNLDSMNIRNIRM